MSIPRLFVIVALLISGMAGWAAKPHPSLPPPIIPECLGVNIHFTDPKPGELEMLAAAGFKWVRMDFHWAGTERKKGEYDFSAYDRLVAKLDEHKLRAVFILDYGNPLYAELGDQQPFTSRVGTPEYREAFARWAVAAVSHFKGRGYLWEMWNEPNHEGFWKPKADVQQYIALARATGEALRSAGLIRRDTLPRVPDQLGTPALPDAHPSSEESGTRGSASLRGEAYIGPATSEIDLPYLEACFKAGLLEFWDAVSVHPYRQSAPETVEEEYRSLRLLIRKYAPKDKAIPVISGEWGYSAAWKDFDEEKQAKYLSRQLLTNIANDVALSIWYDWHDDGTNPKDPEHHFGIVANEYHAGRDPVYDPKPAYTAMKTLSEQLGGFRFNKALGHEVPRDWSPTLLFCAGREIRIASWHIESPEVKPEPPRQLGVVNYSAPEKMDEKERWLVVAGWERLPLEFVVRAPGILKVPFSLKNPVVDTWKFEVATDLFYSYTDHLRIPEFRDGVKSRELLGFREVSEQVSIEIAWHGKGHAVWQLLHLGNGKESFVQWSHIIVANGLEVVLLPPGPEMQPLELRNPSAEPFHGEVSVWFRPNAGNEQPPQRLNFARGELSQVLLFPIPNRPYENLTVWINDDASKPHSVLSPDFLKPEPAALIQKEKLRASSDGDPKATGDVRIDDANPAVGPAPGQITSLKLSYLFGAGWRFGQLCLAGSNTVLRSRGDRYDWRILGLWLHGDGKRCQARIRFKDSTGQTFQPDGPKIDWKGWRYVTFPMQSTEDKPLAHWGGKNDGVIHYPIEWDAIFLLDNVSRQPVEGEIYLSAPTLIY